MAETDDRRPLLSMEGVITLIAALFFWEAEVNWELRCFGVLATSILAVHAARRMGVSVYKKAALAFTLIGVLLISTWRPIWTSFHEDFPAVTGETVLSRIIVFCALCAVGVAGYVFLLRPRRDGHRLIPAQLMAFGVSMIAAGVVAAVIGLLWQFQQNRAMGITTTTGPNLLPAPNIPQIVQTPPPQALPPPRPTPQAESKPEISVPSAAIPTPEPTAQPLMSGYALTNAGIRALAAEAFKIKEVLPDLVVRMQTNDESARGLASTLVTALNRGGIPSQIVFDQLGGPSETGPIILFDDPENLPPPAIALKATLEKVGLHVRVIQRKVGAFQFFAGPNPDS
jgi:hypothetical protein